MTQQRSLSTPIDKTIPPLSPEKQQLADKLASEGWRIVHGNNARMPQWKKWAPFDLIKVRSCKWKSKASIVWAVRLKDNGEAS